MWQFLMFEEPNALEQLEAKLGMSLNIAEEKVCQFKHQFTHKTWNMQVYSVIEEVNLSEKEINKKNMTWFDLDKRQNYTMPVSMNKVYEFING